MQECSGTGAPDIICDIMDQIEASSRKVSVLPLLLCFGYNHHFIDGKSERGTDVSHTNTCA